MNLHMISKICTLAWIIFPATLYAQDTIRWSDLYVGGEDQMPVPICDIVPQFCMPAQDAAMNDALSIFTDQAGLGEPATDLGSIGLDNLTEDQSLIIADPSSIYLSEGQAWIVVPEAGNNGFGQAFSAATGLEPEQDVVPICGIYAIFCEPGQDDFQASDFNGATFDIDVRTLLDGQAQGPAVIRVKPQDLFINRGAATVAPDSSQWLILE